MNNWDWTLKSHFYRQLRTPWPIRWVHQREQRHISGLIPPTGRIGIVADVGCGVGDSLNLLPVSRFKIGLDRNPDMLRQVRTADALVVADALYLPFKPDSLNVVCCIGVSEYIRHLNRALGEWAATVQARGYLVLSSSPPGWFTFLRKLGISRLYARQAEEVKATARGFGWRCLQHEHLFSQDSYLFHKNTDTAGRTDW